MLLRILQINSGKHINGALVHTLLLARTLRELGHEVHVACHPEQWLWQQCQLNHIPCLATSMKRTWREVQAARRYLQTHQIDVLHTHMSRAHFFGVILRFVTGTPCVATAHNCHFQLHWRWNDRVIANSESTRQFHLRYNRVPADKIETIYVTSDLTKFQSVRAEEATAWRRHLGIALSTPVIGIVGEVTARKGQATLFQALPELYANFPQLQVWVIGRADRKSTYVRRLRQWLYRHKLFQRVKWWGKQRNIPVWMKAMDILAVPSWSEPLGLVALEGQAAGTPVVVSNVGGLPEIVTDGLNGLVTPARQPHALSMQLSKLLSDRDLRARLVANGTPNTQRFSLLHLSQAVAECLERTCR